jgi:glycine/D-amino acid oxidase-like deaminating enzyme
LLRRVQQAGAQVMGGTPVRAIRPEGAGFAADTAAGVVHCRNVVVATNGYTGNASPYLRRRIVPVGSAQIATGDVPEALLSRLMPTNRMYGNTNRVFFYFRRVPGTQCVMAGGRIGRMKSDAFDGFYAHLARELLRVFPELADTPLTHGWHGRIGYTFDELPHLGCTPDGVHFAMGYCGTGVSRSTYFGHKVALQLLNDPSGRTAFDDLVFPSHPLHFAAQAAVPVYETWYRVRDTFNL